MQENLKQLQKRFENGGFESKEQLSKWESALKRSNLITDIKEMEGIKMIVDKYKNQLNVINDLLQNSEELINDSELRKRMWDEKKWIKEFLGYFESAEKTIKTINEEIEKNLE